MNLNDVIRKTPQINNNRKRTSSYKQKDERIRSALPQPIDHVPFLNKNTQDEMLLKKFLRGLAFVDEEQRNYNNPLAIKAPNINRNRMTSPQFFSISFRM